jgi:hypothetical protein
MEWFDNAIHCDSNLYYFCIPGSTSLVRVIPPLLFLPLTNSELRLTYMAKEPTSTNNKHITWLLLTVNCVTSPHIRKLTDIQETRHVTATYCWYVTSSLLCQLPDIGKTQLALLLLARVMFTELLLGNVLIKYVTICYCCHGSRVHLGTQAPPLRQSSYNIRG